MALYYLIPNTVDGAQLLHAGQTATSANVQPSSTETVSKMKIESSKNSTVYIQHSKTANGPWVSYNPDTGTTVDSTEEELYYYLDANQYIRCHVVNSEAADLYLKVWLDTDTDPIYCKPQEVYMLSGIDNSVIPHTDIMRSIVMATAEVDRATNQVWNQRTQTDEIFNGDSSAFYHVRKFPLISVSSLDVNGTTVTPSYLEMDYDAGRIGLDPSQAVEVGTFYTSGDGFMKNTITYDYGRATTPQEIRKLTAAITAVMILTEQTGGTYDDVTNFTLGSRSISVGEPWVNIENTMKHLEKMIKDILKNIPKQYSVY